MKTLVNIFFALLLFTGFSYGQIDKMQDQLNDVEAEEQGLMTLRFINAVNGEPIPDATVIIQEAGEFQTDLEGKLRFRSFATEGRYPFRFSKPGFITSDDYFEVIAETIFQNRFTMSPDINLGTYRIVLDWSGKPKDLDAHLIKVGEYHVSYRYLLTSKDGYVTLDRNDIDGYGPETITITNLDDNAEYEFYVNDYSNNDKKKSKALSKSKARVKVYGDGKLLYTIQVSPKIAGNSWLVFRIENGRIVPVDEVRYYK